MLAVHCSPWCTARAVRCTGVQLAGVGCHLTSAGGDNGPKLVDRFRDASAGKLALTHRPRSAMYGISFFPTCNTSFSKDPFEESTKDRYSKLMVYSIKSLQLRTSWLSF